MTLMHLGSTNVITPSELCRDKNSVGTDIPLMSTHTGELVTWRGGGGVMRQTRGLGLADHPCCPRKESKRSSSPAHTLHYLELGAAAFLCRSLFPHRSVGMTEPVVSQGVVRFKEVLPATPEAWHTASATQCQHPSPVPFPRTAKETRDSQNIGKVNLCGPHLPKSSLHPPSGSNQCLSHVNKPACSSV